MTCKANGVSGNYCTVTVGSMVWRLEVGTLKGIVTGIDLKLAQ